MSETSSPEHRLNKWKARLLGNDEDEYVALWKYYSERDRRRRYAGCAWWIRFLTLNFGGRGLADLTVPGVYWRSGLFFVLLRLMTDETDRAMARALGIDPDRYRLVESGRQRPVEAELDAAVNLLRDRQKTAYLQELMNRLHGRPDSGGR